MNLLPDEYTALDAAYVAAIVRGDDTEAGRLAIALDTPRRSVGGMAAESAALWYASQGWPVFPCWPNDKRPLTRHGFKDATTDPDQIRTWWETTPDANIGLRTGDMFDVFDFDGGEESALAFNKAITADGDCPPIRGVAATPRGMHLYVPATGRGNSAGIFPGVDYRGDGGYVVAPPSRTALGVYRWLLPPERG